MGKPHSATPIHGSREQLQEALRRVERVLSRLSGEERSDALTVIEDLKKQIGELPPEVNGGGLMYKYVPSKEALEAERKRYEWACKLPKAPPNLSSEDDLAASYMIGEVNSRRGPAHSCVDYPNDPCGACGDDLTLKMKKAR